MTTDSGSDSPTRAALNHSGEITTSTMCIRHPYLFTSGWERSDIWRLDWARGDAPRHVAELPDFIGEPYPNLTQGIVVDVERDVLIILLPSSPSYIRIYRLTNGECLDAFWLDGWMERWLSPCLNGQILLATCEDEDAAHPYIVSRITSCKWSSIGEQRRVQHVRVPLDLQQRANRKVDLVPLVLTTTGDIIGASAESFTDTVDIMQWRGPNFLAGQEPVARLELSTSLEDGHLI
jgi:hypothetical protein